MKTDLQIIDKTTGEMLPIGKRSSDMKEYVLSLDNTKKADLLTKANYLKRVASNIEKTIKSFVGTLQLDFDNENVAMWQDFKIRKMWKSTFDKEKFNKEGSEEEKEVMRIAEAIQAKYRKNTEYIKF